MSKESLFDMESSAYGVIPVGPARARSVDPQSSHEAAERHNRGRAQTNMAIVLALVREFSGYTAVELHASQHKSDLDRVEIGRRLDSLVKAGKVRKGEQRLCNINKAMMLTWWPVEKTA